MLIDLSDFLSHEDKRLNLSAELEMDSFQAGRVSYPIADKTPVRLDITGIGGKKIKISAAFDVTLMMPCDRCLEEVRQTIHIDTSKEVNLSETGEDRKEAEDEVEELDGTSFDVERFAYGEILLDLPMKVLCREACKGLCSKCGKNLNRGSCDCDTASLDPRMAKALEVFNSFKEV